MSKPKKSMHDLFTAAQLSESARVVELIKKDPERLMETNANNNQLLVEIVSNMFKGYNPQTRKSHYDFKSITQLLKDIEPHAPVAQTSEEALSYGYPQIVKELSRLFFVENNTFLYVPAILDVIAKFMKKKPFHSNDTFFKNFILFDNQDFWSAKSPLTPQQKLELMRIWLSPLKPDEVSQFLLKYTVGADKKPMLSFALAPEHKNIFTLLLQSCDVKNRRKVLETCLPADVRDKKRALPGLLNHLQDDTIKITLCREYLNDKSSLIWKQNNASQLPLLRDGSRKEVFNILFAALKSKKDPEITSKTFASILGLLSAEYTYIKLEFRETEFLCFLLQESLATFLTLKHDKGDPDQDNYLAECIKKMASWIKVVVNNIADTDTLHSAKIMAYHRFLNEILGEESKQEEIKFTGSNSTQHNKFMLELQRYKGYANQGLFAAVQKGLDPSDNSETKVAEEASRSASEDAYESKQNKSPESSARSKSEVARHSSDDHYDTKQKEGPEASAPSESEDESDEEERNTPPVLERTSPQPATSSEMLFPAPGYPAPGYPAPPVAWGYENGQPAYYSQPSYGYPQPQTTYYSQHPTAPHQPLQFTGYPAPEYYVGAGAITPSEVLPQTSPSPASRRSSVTYDGTLNRSSSFSPRIESAERRNSPEASASTPTTPSLTHRLLDEIL